MAEYDETADSSQRAELYGPDDDDGFYTSQLHDWIPLDPQLRDSAVRLYWILRALVIEKRGPVRKLTLLQLCYLLPAKQMKPGESAQPSSLARIRSLLKELSEAMLLRTPEGKPLKTSSRANASGAPLRIRVNNKPPRGYTGPRNAFALLDEVRKPAAEAAERALRKERERAAKKRAAKAAAEAGQISSPQGAGQISSPLGQISSPLGQISSPDSRADLQDREPPFSPPVHTLRSDSDGLPVRPSVQEVDASVSETDGGTDAGSTHQAEEAERPTASGNPYRETTPGMEVLTRLGQASDILKLVGKPLVDQARNLDGVIAEAEAKGDPWNLADLVEILGAPLDGPIRKTAGAVISARIKLLPPTPHTAMLPEQAGNENRRPGCESSSVPDAADRSVDDSTTRRPRGECPRCQGDSPGDVLCSKCLGWPLCEGGCSLRLKLGGTCDECQHRLAIEQAPAEDGTCAGHGGPCGRPIVNLGLCHRCRVKAEAAKRAADLEWERSVAVAVASAESQQATMAPF